MRKALIPMLASLALCGAAATAMAVSTASAQPGPHTPMMVAQADTPPPPTRRGFNRPAPADIAARLKDMCDNSVARETGRLAYLETRLELTASQRPLFQRWRDAKLGVAHRHADQCNSQITQRLAQRQAQGQAAQTQQGQAQQNPTPQGRTLRGQRTANQTSPAERMAREEDRLKQRLADIQAERPALEALTNTLSPNQKTEIARASEQRRDGVRNMMRRRFAMEPRPGPMGPDRPRLER